MLGAGGSDLLLRVLVGFFAFGAFGAGGKLIICFLITIVL